MELVNRQGSLEAAMLANAILDLRPNPEDWIVGWEGHPPPNWIEAVTRIMVASLALPVEIQNEDVVEAFNEWIERKVWAPMRVTSPDRYQGIVDHLRSFVTTASEEHDDEPAT